MSVHAVIVPPLTFGDAAPTLSSSLRDAGNVTVHSTNGATATLSFDAAHDASASAIFRASDVAISHSILSSFSDSLSSGRNSRAVIVGEADASKDTLFVSLAQSAAATLLESGAALRVSIFTVGCSDDESLSDALAAAAGVTSRGGPAPPALVLRDHPSLGVGAHGAWEVMATTTQDVGELVAVAWPALPSGSGAHTHTRGSASPSTGGDAGGTVPLHVIACLSAEWTVGNDPRGSSGSGMHTSAASEEGRRTVTSRCTLIRLAAASSPAPSSPASASRASGAGSASPTHPSSTAIPRWVRALASVLGAVETRAPTIPWASSRATLLLRDLLSGREAGAIVVVAPNESPVGPSTLQFGLRLRAAGVLLATSVRAAERQQQQQQQYSASAPRSARRPPPATALGLRDKVSSSTPSRLTHGDSHQHQWRNDDIYSASQHRSSLSAVSREGGSGSSRSLNTDVSRLRTPTTAHSTRNTSIHSSSSSSSSARKPPHSQSRLQSSSPAVASAARYSGGHRAGYASPRYVQFQLQSSYLDDDHGGGGASPPPPPNEVEAVLDRHPPRRGRGAVQSSAAGPISRHARGDDDFDGEEDAIRAASGLLFTSDASIRGDSILSARGNSSSAVATSALMRSQQQQQQQQLAASQLYATSLQALRDSQEEVATLRRAMEFDRATRDSDHRGGADNNRDGANSDHRRGADSNMGDSSSGQWTADNDEGSSNSGQLTMNNDEGDSNSRSGAAASAASATFSDNDNNDDDDDGGALDAAVRDRAYNDDENDDDGDIEVNYGESAAAAAVCIHGDTGIFDTHLGGDRGEQEFNSPFRLPFTVAADGDGANGDSAAEDDEALPLPPSAHLHDGVNSDKAMTTTAAAVAAAAAMLTPPAAGRPSPPRTSSKLKLAAAAVPDAAPSPKLKLALVDALQREITDSATRCTALEAALRRALRELERLRGAAEDALAREVEVSARYRSEVEVGAKYRTVMESALAKANEEAARASAERDVLQKRVAASSATAAKEKAAALAARKRLSSLEVEVDALRASAQAATVESGLVLELRSALAASRSSEGAALGTLAVFREEADAECSDLRAQLAQAHELLAGERHRGALLSREIAVMRSLSQQQQQQPSQNEQQRRLSEHVSESEGRFDSENGDADFESTAPTTAFDSSTSYSASRSGTAMGNTNFNLQPPRGRPPTVPRRQQPQLATTTTPPPSHARPGTGAASSSAGDAATIASSSAGARGVERGWTAPADTPSAAVPAAEGYGDYARHGRDGSDARCGDAVASAAAHDILDSFAAASHGFDEPLRPKQVQVLGQQRQQHPFNTPVRGAESTRPSSSSSSSYSALMHPGRAKSASSHAVIVVRGLSSAPVSDGRGHSHGGAGAPVSDGHPIPPPSHTRTQRHVHSLGVVPPSFDTRGSHGPAGVGGPSGGRSRSAGRRKQPFR